MSEPSKDAWINAQLNDVMREIHEKHDASANEGAHRAVPSVCNFARLLCAGRFDLSVALMIMAVGYALHAALTYSKAMSVERTRSDDEMRELAVTLTWADLESLFSQLGVALWKTLWRPPQ